MEEKDESKLFSKKPKRGDKIKVYYKIRNKEPDYGIAVKVVNKDDREILIVKKCDEKFYLTEIDFCLDAYKVDFVK